MKRILLFFAAAILTVGVSAHNFVRQLPTQKKQDLHMNLGVFNSLQSKMQAGHLFDTKVKAVKAMKAPARAESADPELLPAYSIEINYYLDSIGFVDHNLYDGASFLVDGEKAYFAPFAYCDYVEGKVESEECWYQKYLRNNGYSEKVDSVTFTVNKVIAEDGSGNKYVAAVGRFEKSTYTAERTNIETIGAYYFPAYNELAIYDIIGLYDQEGKKSTPVEGYCYAYFDLQPQEDLADYLYTATFSVKDDFDEGEDAGKVYKGDAVAYASYDGMYIQGFDLYTGGNFIKFSYPEDQTTETGYDSSSATIEDYQYFTTVSNTQTHVYYDILTRGVDSGWTTYATPGFFINQNEDGSVTVESDGMSILLGWGPTLGGSIEALKDLSITVSTEKYNASVKPATVKTTAIAYYDLQGRKVNADYKGLLIKKSTMTDGSVKSVKILNK